MAEDILDGTGSTADRKPLQEILSRDTSNLLQVSVPKTAPSLQGVSASGSPKQEEKPPMSYVEMYEMFNPERPETDEEKAVREKREKREAILAAVGDGISALSNLWFTSRYAPNAYHPSNGMSAATKDRWEKLRQEREANRREYSEGYMRARAMDEAKERDERSWRHTIEREKIADENAEKREEREDRKAEQQELMFQVRYALQLGKLTEQGYRNAIAEIKAGTMQELTEANINRLNRTGTGGGRTGGGGKSTPVWKAYNPETGDEITIHATSEANAWSQCPQGFVIRQKPSETITETEQQSGSGRTQKKTKTTTVRNPGGVNGGVAPNGGGTAKKKNGSGDNKWSNTSTIKW